MTSEYLPEPFRSIEKLQSIRDRNASNAAISTEADYAIDLALSPLRKVDRHFLKNVRRDARRILNRKQARAEKLTVSLDSELPICDDDGAELTLHDVIASSSPTPMQSLQSVEFQERVGELTGNNTRAKAFVEALQRGESLAQAADSTGISLSYAKKLRCTLREKVQSVALT